MTKFTEVGLPSSRKVSQAIRRAGLLAPAGDSVPLRCLNGLGSILRTQNTGGRSREHTSYAGYCEALGQESGSTFKGCACICVPSLRLAG